MDATQMCGEPQTLLLTLIGGFMLTCRDQVITLPVSAQRLLAFLGLHTRPLLRSYASGNLWPDSSGPRSAACLRSALWRLRRLGVPAVHAENNYLRLADSLMVDTR